MSTGKKNDQEQHAEKSTVAEVIDITKYIKKRKQKQHEEDLEILENDLSSLITLMELSTDDIAGTLIARHVYDVDLLPGIESPTLFTELKLRISHHKDLLKQLEEHINRQK